MKGYIKRLLREGLLSEDVKLAEKLLKQRNIPLDNPKYLELRAYLGQKNIGFLGQIVRLALASNNVPLMTVGEYVIENKELIKGLPNPITSYSNFNDLSTAVKLLKNSRVIKKVVNMLTNDELAKLLLATELDENMVKLLEGFLKLDSSDRKEFLSKSDKYRTVSVFYEKLDVFIDGVYNFNFKTVLNAINGMDNSAIKLLYSENNMILARIIKYSASKTIGSKSWCIVGEEDLFDSYTRNGENYQYFFFNFDIDVEANEKMIAFTIDKDNKITACHDRYDSVFGNVISYLDKIGIKSKIFKINSRERQLSKLSGFDKIKSDNGNDYLYYIKKKDVVNGKEVIENRYPKYYNDRLKRISRKLLRFLFSKEVKGKNHLDIHIDKFEKVPVTILDYETYKKIGTESINFVYYMLNNFDKVNNNKYDDSLNNRLEMGWEEGYEENYEDVIYSKEGLIEILKKIYSSNIKMTRESKIAIINFLKDNGVDILKLAQLKKGKTGDDLAPSEFGMLVNRGEDMKARIQNKLSGLRRGEDINLNQMEIKYAIDNGFKSIIEKYYKDMLPWFGENQLSYDDLNVYTKLGLLNDIGKVIVSKVNNYGIDTLNSIEKSLYDKVKNL